MLSAKSEGRIYFANQIQDPNSHGYQCPLCDQKVSFVSGHKRSGESYVTDHFRHGKGAAHAIRQRSDKEFEAIDFLVDKLSQEYELEVKTDQVYHTPRGDIPTDLLVREHLTGGKYVDTLVQVESDNFNFNDYLALIRTLGQQGIHFSPILCAHGNRNPNGRYFRDEYRKASGEMIKELTKNEKALYQRLGFMTYFNHDQKSLMLTTFEDYTETCQEDVYSKPRFPGDTDRWIVKHAGSLVEFELKKRAKVLRTVSDRFKFKTLSNNSGILIAVPRLLVIDDYFQKESLAKERGDADKNEEFEERVAIMLDSCSPDELKRLTQKFGADRLGGYALE